MKHAIPFAAHPVDADLKSPTLMSFLDMARWIAASIVFLGHLRNPLFFGYGNVAAADRTLFVKAWYFVTGWDGEAVIVFFVLSGFLVGAAGLARLRAGRFAPRDYVVDRVTRLYLPFFPAILIGYALDCAGSTFFARVGFWDNTQSMIAQKISSAPFAISLTPEALAGNLLMLQNYLVPPLGSNQPLWTISGEFWFYAIFVLAALALGASRSTIVRSLAATGIVGILGLLGPSFVVLLGLWCIGLAIAFFPRGTGLKSGMAFFIFMAFLVLARALKAQEEGWAFFYHLRNYTVAISFALLIHAMRGRSYGWMERLRPFNSSMAGFSYSLYLLHFPAMLFILALIYKFADINSIRTGFRPTDPIGIAIYVITVAVVYVGAWSFSLITERKTDLLRRFLKKRLSINGREATASSS